MLRTILSYGVIAGVIVGVPLFGITVAMNGHVAAPWGAVVGYLTMLVALSTIFLAIKRRRDVELGGVIGFWSALGMGLAISAVAGIFYVVAWEAVLGVTHMDFAGAYANAAIEQQKAKGVTGDALANYTAAMEHWKAEYINPLYRVPMTFAEILPVGVLVSLVSAGLLRNRRFLAVRRA
jgi:hypothetical protein